MGKSTQFKVFPGTEPVKVKHDGKVAISIGKSRKDMSWVNKEILWSVLVGRLQESLKTQETHAQFMRMGTVQQGNIKDVGGFVGGYIKDGRRLKGNVTERQIITLDADHMPNGTDLADLVLEKLDMDVGFVVYSTHKHTPEAPRQRLVIPMARTVSPDEYEAIARKIAEKLGIELFDDSTYEPHRLMYWPSHSIDAKPYFYHFDGEFLDPDAILAEYPDWKDTSFWPYSSRVDAIRKKQADKAGDPLEKPGVIGAFCKAYTVQDAIAKFLPEVYVPCDKPDRYTYAAGSTAAGLVIYNDGLFAYSNHSTDPAGGQLCNAFDLVRVHRFGNLDDEADIEKAINQRSSYKAMTDFAAKDADVRVALAEARTEGAVKDFMGEADDIEAEAQTDGEGVKDWRTLLECKKDGSIAPNARNALIILMYDEHLRGIRLNTMSGVFEAEIGDLPWERDFRFWQNSDTEQLYMWVANTHKVQFPKELFGMALTSVANKRRFNPVRDYLEALPEWDGRKRIHRILLDYLGTQDNIFTREALKKVMLAAVTRIYEPGAKFDYMLILNGTQGMGKSTLFARLFRGFLSDSLTMTEMRDKTGSEKLQGYWALEVAEMAGMRKADIECVKSFISRQEDIYRPAYGRIVEKHPRRCVIVGSTNSETGFLRDVTGNRRFWPIVCRAEGRVKASWDMTEEEVDMLWAEALAAYKDGESLLLSKEAEALALGAQRDALEEDPRMSQVENYLNKKIPKWWDTMDADGRMMYLDGDGDYIDEKDLVERTTCSNMEIWVECFRKRPSEMERKDSDALTALMIKIPGWERTGKSKRIPIYGRQRIYEKVKNDLMDF